MLHLSHRDRDLLQLLDRTPATASLVLKASTVFGGGAFRDERRTRERMQQLTNAGLVRRFHFGQAGGGVMNYYKLTTAGFAALHGHDAAVPPRSYFSEVPLFRLEHTMTLAEVIVHTLVAANAYRIAVPKFHRENELKLEVGEHVQLPDFHVQLFHAGKTFNVLFELDRGNESIDSGSYQAIRQKILGYEAYQDVVWQDWRRGGKRGLRPYFKVAFLTTSASRACNILALAGMLARNSDRRLCYAVALDQYLACADALREPIFLDHFGHWRALVDVHPTSIFIRNPVCLPQKIEFASPLW